MRLAFVHPFLHRYARGIERYTANLASALVSQGVEVDIITWRWPNPLHWSELDPAVQVLTLPTGRYYAALSCVPFLAWQLWYRAYDMVCVHFADYGEARALKLLRIVGRCPPYSIVLHYPYSQVPHRYHTFVGSGLVREARPIVAVSQFVADEAKRSWDAVAPSFLTGLMSNGFVLIPSRGSFCATAWAFLTRPVCYSRSQPSKSARASSGCCGPCPG